jgi:hypothetical protein
MNSVYIILIVIAVFLVYYRTKEFFKEDARIKRKIKNAPRKSISTFKNEEIAKIIGRITESEEPLNAPFSNRTCIAYRIIIERVKAFDENSSYKKIIDKIIIKDFAITENDQIAVVRTKNIIPVIEMDQTFETRIFKDPPPQLVSILKEHGYSSKNLLGINKDIRYNEGILEKGQLVTVLGKGIWKTSDEFEFIPNSSKVLEIVSDNNEPVYLSNDASLIK